MRAKGRTALVLAGGGARGAYQVGVIRYLREALPEPARSRAHFDVITGCSVGAVNGSFLAATAHRPSDQGRLLHECWDALRGDDFFRMHPRKLSLLPQWLLGGDAGLHNAPLHAGLLDSAPFAAIVRERFPWRELQRNIDAGVVTALALSATDIASGRAYVFINTRDGRIPSWGKDPRRTGIPTRIGPEHALASASIPLLFPPVRIGGRWYCDGGLRQITPLSPALRLGADRVLIVSLRFAPDIEEAPVYQRRAVPTFPGALFLVSKVLNSLLLDQLEHDVHNLEVINSIIEAGEATYGPDFRDYFNRAVVPVRGVPYQKTRTLVLRPSKDLGLLATRHAQRMQLSAPWRQLVRAGMRLAAASDEKAEGDLLSYLLFDAPYIDELVELGYNDAAARADELCAFFAEARGRPVPATSAQSGGPPAA